MARLKHAREAINEPVSIIFTVELSNGHFKSQIKAPFPLPESERENIIGQWLDIMATGFRIGATEMDVALALKQEAGDA